MAVDVGTSLTFSAGTSRMLFEFKPDVTVADATLDGSRWLARKTATPPERLNELRVVLNWFEELRQRVSEPASCQLGKKSVWGELQNSS